MSKKTLYNDTIVSAASNLIHEHGFSSISINDIASSCSELNKHVINTFVSKEEIVIYFINNVQLYIDMNILCIAYDETISPGRRVLKLNKALEEFFTLDTNWLSLIKLTIESVDSVPIFSSPIRNLFQSLVNAYREIFETAYSHAEARYLAEDFAAELQGAFIMMRVTGTNHAVRRLSARLIQLLNARESTENE
jgi:TetR/AcrR family transcriptional regulator, transcriptional repressor for nem operon